LTAKGQGKCPKSLDIWVEVKLESFCAVRDAIG
jgi:hypothetical protein